jgi:hypothetical protein
VISLPDARIRSGQINCYWSLSAQSHIAHHVASELSWTEVIWLESCRGNFSCLHMLQLAAVIVLTSLCSEINLLKKVHFLKYLLHQDDSCVWWHQCWTMCSFFYDTTNTVMWDLPIGWDFIIDCLSNYMSCIRFEVFTAVTMKNGIFWDVMPCGSCKNRCFGD